MRAPLLRLENVSKRFSGLLALDGVTTSFYPGEIVGLIGPNGAGKTDAGQCRDRRRAADEAGSIIFDNGNIEGLRPDQIARKRHRAHLPDRRSRFRASRVRENVAAAALFAGGAPSPRCRRRAMPTNILNSCHLTVGRRQIRRLADAGRPQAA